MVAINITGASDEQLQILVIKTSISGNDKWKYGKKFTVESIKEYGCEVIYLNSYGISYSSLAYAEKQHKNVLITIQEYITTMNKSDLKPGMVVELKNSKRLMVAEMHSDLFLLGYHMFDNLCNYNEDLTSKCIAHLSICKVYQPRDKYPFDVLLTSQKGTLIWERPKETVLTMQEIADKFGVPVERLKIKK